MRFAGMRHARLRRTAVHVAAGLLHSLGDGPLQVLAQHLALHHVAALAPTLQPHDQQVGAPAPQRVLPLDASAAVDDGLQVRLQQLRSGLVGRPETPCMAKRMVSNM